MATSLRVEVSSCVGAAEMLSIFVTKYGQSGFLASGGIVGGMVERNCRPNWMMRTMPVETRGQREKIRPGMSTSGILPVLGPLGLCSRSTAGGLRSQGLYLNKSLAYCRPAPNCASKKDREYVCLIGSACPRGPSSP